MYSFVLSIDSSATYRVVDDIVRLFEVTHVPTRNGGFKLSEEVLVWHPTIAQAYSNAKWDNHISFDGRYISENPKKDNAQSSQEHLDSEKEKSFQRIVFGKMEDGLYHFLGVYELDKELSDLRGHCMWKRISKTYMVLKEKIVR